MSLIIPQNYKLKLLPETTEIAIKMIKKDFQKKLSEGSWTQKSHRTTIRAFGYRIK